MNKFRKAKVNRIEKVLSSIHCDVCGKKIENKETYDKEFLVSEYFYIVSTGRHNWGNESYESIEVKEVCCDKCLKEVIDEYLEKTSNTKEIEIRKTHQHFQDILKVVSFEDENEYDEYD